MLDRLNDDVRHEHFLSTVPTTSNSPPKVVIVAACSSFDIIE